MTPEGPEGRWTSNEERGEVYAGGADAATRPDYQSSLEFLKWAQPRGPWCLVAIKLDRKGLEAMTFTPDQEKQVLTWLGTHSEHYNVYFTVNPVNRTLVTKPSRRDIREMTWLHVDVDPRPGHDLAEERAKILAKLEKHEPRPSCIIFSGGGYQAFWRLTEPFEINGKETLYEEAARWNLQLERVLGGDSCHNVDRIMRLPGTINRPDEKKRAKGRTEELARVVWPADLSQAGAVYDLAQFEKAPTGNATQAAAKPAAVDPDKVVRVTDLSTLPVGDLCKRVIAQGCDPDDPTRWTSRSEPLFWVCCEMVRAGVDDAKILGIVTDPVWSISASVLDKGSRTHEYAVRQIERAREEAVHPKLREFNEQYAVVIVGGKTRVLTHEAETIGGQERARLHYMTFADFQNYYSNQFVSYMGGRDGKTPIEVPAAKWWLSHSMRKSFKAVVFAPGREVAGAYNLWRGFAVDPKPGKCDLFLAHLRDNICRGDAVLFEYLLDWMAAAVQQPDEQGHVAIVLRGRQGTGKGAFAKEFGKLFGRHYVRISNSKHILGNFNAHMEDCVVLFVDEAFWAGDKKSKGVLKSLVTEEDAMIERKGYDAAIRPSHLHIIMASNEKWVVPADYDDRRFLVLDVGNEHKEDTAYFGALRREMDAGGREALLHMLLERDISQFDRRRRPETAALQEQKERSLEPEDEWILDLLDGGVLPNNAGRPNRAFCNDTMPGSRDGLYSRAREAVPMLRDATENSLGRVLTDWGCAKSDNGGRRWRQFPPLPDMRRKWCAKHGPREWPGGPDMEWQRCREDLPREEGAPF